MSIFDEFNSQQVKALQASINHNVLISAGAGSGKTRTLSRKVSEIILDENNPLDPTEILVLTFTNNSAYDMRTKIISKFNHLPEIKKKMASAHIQTFDSFAQYLVTKYSGELGVSDNFTIANDDIIKTKKRLFLDEIFLEWYKDPIKCSKLEKTLQKFNISKDDLTKLTVLDMYDHLEKMLPQFRESYIKNYSINFLSDRFVNKCIDIIVENSKRLIRHTLFSAYFVDKNYDLIIGNDLELLNKAINNPNLFNVDLNSIQYTDPDLTTKIYEDLIKPALAKNGLEFFEFINSAFNDEHNDALPAKITDKNIGKEPRFRVTHLLLRSLFKKVNNKEYKVIQGPLLNNIKNFDTNIEVIREKVFKFKDDIEVIFELEEELRERILEYKKKNNVFSFSDISNYGLMLLTNPKYENIAEEIRSSFKFIMIDEYQDTNDVQEMYLDSLTKPNKKGGQAHLFCVGDAKQAIYAFRNSKVELFKNRQQQYENEQQRLNPNHDPNIEADEVIMMNINYRSGKQLLDDINYVFKVFMTMNHGGISFINDAEQLNYDEKVNLYGEKYDNFGISRIEYEGSDDIVGGIAAIAKDIKNKISNGFLVYDKESKGEKIRPCRLNDFAILSRTKANFNLYKQIFAEQGLKLNIIESTNLREIDSVILIQSLVGLLNWFVNGKPNNVDVEHLFASVARSYAFEYDDHKLFDILMHYTKVDEKGRPIFDRELIYQDEIYQKLDKFAFNHKDTNLSLIFNDLVNEFNVISKLYRVGNVEDNIAKIESIYSLVLAQENNGEGIADFVQLLKDFDAFDLNLDAKSSVKVDDAIDLMTIHASKGLEKIIVYMVDSESKRSKGMPSRIDSNFSKNIGLILKDYEFDNEGETLLDEKGYTKYSILKSVLDVSNEDKQVEIDEHVRLLYVALTRAMNIFYIVHPNLASYKPRDDSLMCMLNYLPRHFRLNNSLMEGYKTDQTFLQIYKEYNDKLNSCVSNLKYLDFAEFNDFEKYELYMETLQLYVIKEQTLELNDIHDELKLFIFGRLYNELIKRPDWGSEELMCRLYSYYHYKKELKSYNEIKEYLESKTSSYEIDVDDYDLYENLDEDSNDYGQEDDVEQELTLEEDIALFRDKIIECDREYWKYPKSEKDELKKDFKRYKFPYEDYYLLCRFLMETLTQILRGEAYLSEITYETNGYKDNVIHITLEDEDFHKPLKKPEICKVIVDDTEIEFKEREYKRASKKLVFDEDMPSKEVLERGTFLHSLLEMTDLITKDTSFIKDPNDRRVIDRALTNSIFNDLENAEVHKEYEYYDDLYGTKGSIDLFYIKNGEYYIIDYKSKHVIDDGYEDQLHTYQRNIQTKFNITDKSKIHLILLSIYDNKVVEVEPF